MRRRPDRSVMERLIEENPALRSRRRFLLGAGGLAASAGALGLHLDTLAAAANAASPRGFPSGYPAEDYQALVCLFLFGGNDCANTLVPYDQPSYDGYVMAREGSLSRPYNMTRLRSDLLPIAVPSLTDGRQLALPREMSALKAIYDQGRAAIVSNVGVLSYPTSKLQYEQESVELPPQLYSHSDQQRFWQVGVPSYNVRSGWAGRIGDLLAPMNGDSRVSICMSMAGNNIWQVGAGVQAYPISPQGGAERMWALDDPRNRAALLSMLGASRSNVLERQAVSLYNRTLDAEIEVSEALAAAPDVSSWFPEVPVAMPGDTAGVYAYLMDQLAMVTRLIASRGILGHRREVFFVSIGGFDNHQGLDDHPGLLRAVSDGLAAFYQATQRLHIAHRVCAFTASDFGRPLKSNGSGSDHGWGGHHFVVGGSVRGGDVYGRVPVIEIDGVDTLDYQGHLLPNLAVDQYAATLGDWFGVSPTDMRLVLPNLGRFPVDNLGFLEPSYKYDLPGRGHCGARNDCSYRWR